MGHDDSMRCVPNMLLAMVMTSGLWAADESDANDTGLSTALESAFRITPVHWDKNVSVVEICGISDGGDESMLQWPDTTGELLKLMDALKYEYDMRGFHCVVFAIDAKATTENAPKMLNALIECVTVCDMLRIPLRLTVKNGESWIEVAPTYPSVSGHHLLIAGEGEVSFAHADDVTPTPVQESMDWKQQLESLVKQQVRINLLWSPQYESLPRFVEVLEQCNSLGVDYSLMLNPL